VVLRVADAKRKLLRSGKIVTRVGKKVSAEIYPLVI
jgi:hypothetical protein